MHPSPYAKTDPVRTPRVAESGLAGRLTRTYAGRLAPGFVRRVLREEQRRDPTRPDDVIETAARGRLDAWLDIGRYPLTDESAETTHPSGAPGGHPGPHARMVPSS